MKVYLNKILCVCFFLYLQSSIAQYSFQKLYGGSGDDYCFSVRQCADKGFIFAGYTDSYGAGANDCFVTKTDSLGSVIWSKTYGGSRDDEAYSVKQTKDGGYIIAGYSKSFGNLSYDAYLIKIDSNGDTLWSKTYGGINNDFANTVQETIDTGLIFLGYTTSFVAGGDSGNIYLVKTDAAGNISWLKAMGGTTAISDGYSVEQTTDKGYILTGYTNGFGEPNGDVFLTKTDSIGNVAWTKTYGSSGIDWGNSVKQTSDGGYIVAGSASFDTTNLIDVYLIKTNSVGDTLWTKTYGGTGYDYGQAVQILSNGSFMIVGYSNSCVSGNNNMFYLHADVNGNMIGYHENDLSSDDEANYVFQTKDGDFIIGGNTYKNGNYDVYLLKVDSTSASICYNKNCSVIQKEPHTVQKTQTMQVYASANATNHVASIADTCSKSSFDVCATGIDTHVKSTLQLNVYPNPNNGTFILSNTKEIMLNISVQNILGETVYTGFANTFKELNLQNLTVGTYFLRASYLDQISVQKIIIAK